VFNAHWRERKEKRKKGGKREKRRKKGKRRVGEKRAVSGKVGRKAFDRAALAHRTGVRDNFFALSLRWREFLVKA